MPSLLAQIFATGFHQNIANIVSVEFAAYELSYNVQSNHFIIAIHTAPEYAFPDKTKPDQPQSLQLKREELINVLKNDLQQCDLIEHKHYIVEKDYTCLFISPAGLSQLISSSHKFTIDLRAAVNYLRVIDMLHNNPNSGKRIITEMILEGGQLFNYVRTDSELFSHPHLFYIGNGENYEGKEQVIINIGEQTAQLMRNAIKHRIKQLEPDAEMHDVKFAKESGGPQHQVAFMLSKESFRRLIGNLNINLDRISDKRLNIKQGVPTEPVVKNQPDIKGGETIKPRSLNSERGQLDRTPKIDVSTFNEEEKEELKIAKVYLTQHIYKDYINKKPPDDIPPHSEKERLLVIAIQPFLHINSINVMVAVYEYINDPVRKKILNIHQNPNWDDKLYKYNTDKWMDFLGQVREHAFEKLLKKLGIFEKHLQIVKKTTPKFDDPQKVINELKPYLTNPLFYDHRSNYHVLNWIHNTKTVNKLQSIFDACTKQLQEEAADSARKNPLLIPLA